MNSKVFVIVLIALFDTQGLVDAGNFPHNAKSLQQVAIDAIEELKGILQSVIDEAKTQLNELIIDVQQFAQEVIAQGTADIQADIDKVLNAIEALRQQSAGIGQSIESCIEDQEDVVEQIGISHVNTLVVCVGVQNNNTLDFISAAIAYIEATYNVVADLESQLDACNGGLICISGVITDCAIATSSLPLQIAKQVVRALNFILAINIKMTICATSTVASSIFHAGEIITNLVECALDIIQ